MTIHRTLYKFCRQACAIALAALVVPGAMAAQETTLLLQRATAAMGGQALAQVHALRVEGKTTFHDPEQSRIPHGEPRLGTEAAFVQVRDLQTGNSRVEWRSRAMRPTERLLTYTESINGTIGHVTGNDSILQVAQARASGSHAMSAMRVAVNRRELLRTSPRLLLQMQNEPGKVHAAHDITINGKRLPALAYATEFGEMTVAFSPDTGLPERLRTLDYDPIQADSDFDLILSDWREVGGVRYPFQQRYEINGMVVAETTITAVAANPAVDAAAFAVPGDAHTQPPAEIPYQWVLRKQGFGVLLDSDAVVYDAAAIGSLRLQELAPSIWLVTGGFYNTLMVELDDALVVYDAPHEIASQWILAEAAQRFPGKPVKYVVLTHHHMDHAGGLRSYVAQGAAVVVGKGVGASLRQALQRPATLGLPSLRTTTAMQAMGNARIIEVDGPFSFGSGDVRAQAYPVDDNPHATGMLFGYVPHARLGFVSDIWSPGRGPLPPAGTELYEDLQALAHSVDRWKLDPARFAGGHGSVGDYAPVRRLLSSGP